MVINVPDCVKSYIVLRNFVSSDHLSSLFLLVGLAEGLPVLLLLSENHYLTLLVFFTVFLFSISLSSALIFIISFLLLALGLACLF